MRIYIDTREKTRVKQSQFHYTAMGHETIIKELNIGDYIFQNNNGCVCFEFKLINDFLASIKNNRVFNQAINQYETYPHQYVIIVGDEIDCENALAEHGITKTQYYGAIARLNTYTTVIHAPDTETAYNIMYCQADKCLDSKIIYKTFHPKLPTPAMNYLYGASGIGDVFTERIIKTLEIKTLWDLLHLTKEDLIQVEGIGEKRAETIMNAINE